MYRKKPGGSVKATEIAAFAREKITLGPHAIEAWSAGKYPFREATRNLC
jgi:hypothetical protein